MNMGEGQTTRQKRARALHGRRDSWNGIEVVVGCSSGGGGDDGRALLQTSGLREVGHVLKEQERLRQIRAVETRVSVGRASRRNAVHLNSVTSKIGWCGCGNSGRARLGAGRGRSCSILIPTAALAQLVARQCAGANGKCSILTCCSVGPLARPAFTNLMRPVLCGGVVAIPCSGKEWLHPERLPGRNAIAVQIITGAKIFCALLGPTSSRQQLITSNARASLKVVCLPVVAAAAFVE